MARKPSKGPTERELDILQVLWGQGESSVREVQQCLAASEEISFTSVQTVLQIMFDKGLVGRELKGRSYVYRPAISQEAVQRTLLTNLLDRAFGGSAKALVSRALDVKRTSMEDLDEIRALLDEARRSDDA